MRLDRIMSDTSNSYDPPQATPSNDTANSQPSRDSLAELIQSFLASNISAFAFDEQLDAFRGSDDPVIRHVVDAVWYYYDDCDDHLVCLSKQEWDYFQRLLLVLASDCRVQTKSCRRWSVRQLIAGLSLCLFAYFAVRTGWGQHLFILSIPFGAISIALSFWSSLRTSGPDPFASIIFPFATFSDLATAYRLSGFRKTQYPKHIGERAIRSPFMAAVWQIHAYAMWLILSPIPLLLQTLPERQAETRIVAA
jgi:hypothetical protein